MRILLVEDNSDHRELMRLALTEYDATWQVEGVVSGEAAMRRLSEGEAYDLVFLDYSLPERNGLGVLEEIRRGEAPLPVVLVTGRGDERVAVEAMKGGAYDYVVKGEGYLQRLPVVAQRAMEANRTALERKQAEEALRRGEERFHTSVETLLEGFAILSSIRDSDGQLIDFRYEYINEAGCKMNQNPREEHIGRTLLELFPEQKGMGLFNDYVRVVETGQPLAKEYASYESVYGGSDRLKQAFDVRIIRLEDGVVVTWQDITEKKKGQELLRRSEERLKRLIENSKDIVVMADLEGEVLYYNGPPEYGVRAEDVLGKNAFSIFEPVIAARLMNQLRRVVKEKEALTIENFISRRGEPFWFSTHMYPIQDEQNRMYAVGVIARNITERKQVEEAIRQRTVQMEALQQVGLELVTQLNLDALLRSIVLRAVELVDGDSGGLYLYRPERGVLEWAMNVGPNMAPIGTILRKGEGFSGKIWETGQPLIVDDYKQWEGRAAVYEGYPFTAIVGVPIRWGELLGVLNVLSDSPHTFSQADVEVLNLFATQAAIAIRNARLYEVAQQEITERKQAEEKISRQSAVLTGINKIFREALICQTEEELARTCLAVAQQLTGSKFGFIDEINQAGRLDTIALSNPGWDACKLPKSDALLLLKDMEIRGIPGRVIKDGQTVIANEPVSHPDWVGIPEDHPPVANFIGVPLKHMDKTIGLIGLANKETGYDTADQEAIETLSIAIVESLMRKRAEEAVRESLNRWQTTFEGIEDSIFLLDKEGVIFQINKNATKLFGKTEKEIQGHHCWEIVHGTSEPIADCPIVRMKQSKQRETMLLPVNDKWYEVTVDPLLNQGGNLLGAVHIISDITECKRIEEALKKSEVLHKEAQKTAHIGHWELDTSIMVPTWSEEIFRIFGLDPQKDPPSFAAHQKVTHPDDWHILNNAVTTSINEGIPFDIKFRILRPDKTIHWMHAIGYPKRDSEGRIGSVFGTAQDVTESKQAEDQIRSSEAQMRSLSARLQDIREEERTLISREIHDELGQELTGLKMDLSWLVKRLSKNQKSLISKIESMLKLVDSTIQTVRRISSELRPGVLDDLGLIAAIEWQAQDFENRTGITCDFNSSVEEIGLDRDRSTAVFRIFEETLTNVFRHAKATRVKISLEKSADSLILRIEDNGKGIKESEVYNPKSLGLLGMRERSLLFGGEVEISGIPEKGTSVVLKIPLER